MNKLKDAEKIHFIGIGGIGVSALARMMLEAEKEVHGSDASASDVVTMLGDLGASVSIGHHADNLEEDTELVIYSVAVPHENPELKKARERGIPTLTYAEALGEISDDKVTIAVAGTHGKTTTTAMLATITEKSEKVDPTVVVGSLLNGKKSNFISGKDEYFIVEACEYKRSFLQLHPDILIITNIDNDHLDYFSDITDIQSAFAALVRKVPESGYIVCDPSLKTVVPILEYSQANVVDYSSISGGVTLPVPGDHNRKNAKAAIAAASCMGISETDGKEALTDFKGTWRRSEHKGNTPAGALVYDDYAHHPTEIRATLAGFREAFPQKEIIAVFQPHLFSRTKLLLDELSQSFSDAEDVLVLPIYAAREVPDQSIESIDLVEGLQGYGVSATAVDTADAKQYLRQHTSSDTLVITMGAGDIYKLADDITT